MQLGYPGSPTPPRVPARAAVADLIEDFYDAGAPNSKLVDLSPVFGAYALESSHLAFLLSLCANNLRQVCRQQMLAPATTH